MIVYILELLCTTDIVETICLSFFGIHGMSQPRDLTLRRRMNAMRKVLRRHDVPQKCYGCGNRARTWIEENPSVVISLDYESFLELQGAKEASTLKNSQNQ
jgi:hypothetical protein